VTGSLAKFRTGFSAPLRGLELIFANPRVRHAAIIPFALVLFTFMIGIFFGLQALYLLIPWLANTAIIASGITTATFGASVIYYVLISIAAPVGVFALLFMLYLISQLIAAPFYAILAERVLIEKGLIPDRPFRFKEWANVSAHLFAVSLGKVVIFGAAAAVLFIISFIPGLGILSAFGFLLMTAFDVVDISLEALRMGLKERMRFFRAELPAFVGLACTLGLVFLIPGLNFLLFPASIAGAHGIIAQSLAYKGLAE
jgi:uncharacterized protein involved in cysteine biosynthesis